ncbi:hypothetical protein V8G54_013706 [Vigna mungo]|uniref:Uncharacterized protein n=1 Tax=Vigna mungo TaxID=3915 RepID=A0AAQ3NG75_VIGMU
MQDAIVLRGTCVDAHDHDVSAVSEALDFVHVRGLRYDEPGFGGGGLLGQLLLSVEGVGSGDDGAAVGGAEEGKGELGAVAQDEHDDVTLADADVVEAGGDAAGGEVDFGVGECFAGVAVDKACSVLELEEVLEAVRV